MSDAQEAMKAEKTPVETVENYVFLGFFAEKKVFFGKKSKTFKVWAGGNEEAVKGSTSPSVWNKLPDYTGDKLAELKRQYGVI